MHRFVITALGALALAASSCAAAQGIDWTLGASDRPGHVQLRLERNRADSRNSNSFPIAPANLSGLNPDAEGPVRFTLRREAGRVDCDGVMHRRRGVGTCSFAADPAFGDALARRGIARPNEDYSYSLTVLDVHLATVDALARFGFPRPTLDQLFALTVHGANSGWLQELAAAGQRGTTIDDLIAYRIHGVSGTWLHGLIGVDPTLAHIRGGDVIAMRIHGVTPEWVHGLANAGYRNIAASDLVAMRIHGVTPAFAAAAASMGRRPSAGELVSRRIMGRN